MRTCKELLLLPVLVIGLSLPLLANCARLAQTPETKLTALGYPPVPAVAACTAFPRISYSRLHDTDETLKEIKAYLAARDALCGAGK